MMAEGGGSESEEQREEDNISNDINCTIHPEEIIRLFCTDCDVPTCIKCFLEKHQQHSFKSIPEILPHIQEKVKEWCLTNHEMTKETLQLLKHDVQSEIDKSGVLETEAKQNIQECKEIWITKIERETEVLTKSWEKAFSESRKPMRSVLSQIECCEEDLEKFETEANGKCLHIYYNMKKCLDREGILGDKIEPENPNVVLCSPPDDFLIGNIDVLCSSNSAATHESKTHNFSVQTYYGNDLFTNNGSDTHQQGLVFSISLESLGSQITKVLPISRTDAWLISNKKLYKLTISGIQQYSSYTDEADDIALMSTGDLLILNRKSSFINQLNESGFVTPFTSCDPYLPLSMDYIEKENVLLIWMADKDTRQMSQFSGNGEKKKSFSLSTSKPDCSILSAYSSNNFSLVYDVIQTTGERNYIFTYIMEPKAYSTFAGKYGQSPYLQFVCKGQCYDNEGNILASDMKFNTIYKLEGKSQKILLDKNAGLSSPTSLGYKEGFLWVADSTHLKVFDYSQLK